jgi:SAM-dependent methyltransferase
MGEGIVIIPPAKPDCKTYLQLCGTKHSLSRFMQFSIFSNISFNGGSVLDIGGEPRSPKDCKLLFSGYDSWSTLNVNPAKSPDFVCDCNHPLPFENESFGHVVSINVLEHIKNIDLAVGEICRITKPGGLIVLALPFLFGVHGDPDDYHRLTASWWRDKLEQLGIGDERQKIYPICWDSFSSALSLLDNFWPVLLRRLLRPIILLPGLLFSFRHNREYWRKLSLPLGYVVVAQKQP